MNCESEIVVMAATAFRMAPPLALGPPPLLAWLPVNAQLRTAKATPGLLSIAPPKPPSEFASLPPWAVLFSKVHWDKVLVTPLPVKGKATTSSLLIAPPAPEPVPLPSAWLLANVLSLMVAVAPSRLPIAPPKLPPGGAPKSVVLPRAALPVKVAPVIARMPALAIAPPKLLFVPLVWLLT